MKKCRLACHFAAAIDPRIPSLDTVHPPTLATKLFRSPATKSPHSHPGRVRPTLPPVGVPWSVSWPWQCSGGCGNQHSGDACRPAWRHWATPPPTTTTSLATKGKRNWGEW